MPEKTSSVQPSAGHLPRLTWHERARGFGRSEPARAGEGTGGSNRALADGVEVRSVTLMHLKEKVNPS